jgi:hypothetical protein
LKWLVAAREIRALSKAPAGIMRYLDAKWIGATRRTTGVPVDFSLAKAFARGTARAQKAQERPRLTLR